MINTENKSNATANFSSQEGQEACEYQPIHVVVLSLNDIITLLIGQPVIARLLWTTSTSKKTLDILNCNLALFHNMQYLASIMHLFALFLLPHRNQLILKFLFVYVQTGGPMSLSYICLERFVAVIYPMSYPLLKKYRCREVGAVTVWLISVPAAFANVFAPDIPSFLGEKVLSLVPLGVMLVMTAMMVLCSHSIARVLRKSSPGKDLLHPGKKRALKTVRATSVITLLCYVPVTSLQWFSYGDMKTYDCVITPIGIFLLSAASVVHPLFYLSTQGKLFPCLK